MTVVERFITGMWRSYRVFYFSGKVEKHTTSSYSEILIDEDRVFTLHARNNKSPLVLQPDQWQVIKHKKNWYIYFDKKQAFEIITLESEHLVLADPVRGEKLFFTRLPQWNSYVEQVATSVKHQPTPADIKK